MVTGVGLDTASSCAAIRATIDNFQDTRFMDKGGEWVLGSEVPLEKPWRGTRKLAKMLAMALTECSQEAGLDLAIVPILICLAEKERPGRVENLANKIFFETQEELNIKFHKNSSFVEHGRVGGLVAMKLARSMLYDKDETQIMVAGVDSLLTAPAIRHYEDKERVLTSINSNGFIPGEGACAVLIQKPRASKDKQLICSGLGFGLEQVTINSEEPFRADGLTKALKEALVDANTTMDDTDFRIVDVSGEQYWFKEASLVLSRILRVHKEGYPLWHPADCVGEVGAAISLIALAYLKEACDKDFSEGHKMIQHSSNDDQRRSAAIYRYCEVSS